MMIKVTNTTTSQIALPFVGAVGAPTGSNTSTLPVGTSYTYEVPQKNFDQIILALDALKTKGYITYQVVAETQIPAAGVEVTVGTNGFDVTMTLTTAEANAGKTIVADSAVPTGLQARIKGISLTVGGGTAWSATASSTKLLIDDTAGSPVELAEVALGALTGNVVIYSPTNVTMKAPAVTGATANKGLTIRSDGTHDVAAGSTITLHVWGTFA